MDFPHLHLLLNHFPIIGTMVGAGLFLTSLVVRTEDVRLSSLVVFIAVAVLAIWFMEVTGALAVIALWQCARRVPPAPWNTLAILAFSLLTVVLMARTGNTGGEIRHSEIRSAEENTAPYAALAYFEPSPAKFTRLMIVNKWWWAFMMDMHFFGLFLLIGTIGMLNLRVLA